MSTNQRQSGVENAKALCFFLRQDNTMEALVRDVWLTILPMLEPTDIQRLALSSRYYDRLVGGCWKHIASEWSDEAHTFPDKESALRRKGVHLCSKCKSRKSIEFIRYNNASYSFCAPCNRGLVFISKTEAKKNFKLAEKDLASMPHHVMPNGNMPTHVYMEWLVRERSHEKHGGPDGLAKKIEKCQQIAQTRRKRAREREFDEQEAKRRKLDK